MDYVEDIIKLNNGSIYLLTVAYFSLLYFGVGSLFLKVCHLLEKRGFVRRIVEKTPETSRLRQELLNSTLSILIFGFSGVLLVYFLRWEILSVAPFTWLGFFAGSFLLLAWNEVHFYVIHRLLHLPYLYKKIHKIHHQSKVPSVFSVYSFHWLEALLLSTVPFFIAFVFTLPLEAYVAFPLLSILFNFAGHCNYRFGSGEGNGLRLFGTRHARHHFRNKGEYGFITHYIDLLLNPKKNHE